MSLYKSACAKVCVSTAIIDQQIGHNLKRIFIEIYYKFLVQVALDCGLNPRQVELPLNVRITVHKLKIFTFK